MSDRSCSLEAVYVQLSMNPRHKALCFGSEATAVLSRLSFIPPFAEAIKGDYKPIHVGHNLGPTWSTHWFKVHVKIPKEYSNEEVLLIFDPDCEGMVWSSKGEPLMGITGGWGGDRHVDYRLTQKAKEGEEFKLYIEVACNGMFGAGLGNMIDPPQNDRHDQPDLPSDTQGSNDALYTANQVVNIVRHDDWSTIEKARSVTTEFFKTRKDTGHSDHTIVAIGNCHIDTGCEELGNTMRVCPEGKRLDNENGSLTTLTRLMEDYPEFKFTASQAQQFEWVEQNYPELFERIKHYEKRGSFIPIGGKLSWNNINKVLTSDIKVA
ncbi:hypothetical protein HK104_000399 [Borealophlyctis nickersoniae]|nr:hypothetical protein HK104_000399 [Borealophlyctis nickersoniae]